MPLVNSVKFTDVNHLPETLLPRILTRFDVTAIYFALVFASYGAAQMATQGWAAIPMLILAAVIFLLPTMLAAYALGTAYPGEGGIYIWAQKAFGPIHGFISGWLSWVPVLLLLPLGVTAATAHIKIAFQIEWAHSTEIAVQVGLVWLETFICVQKLRASQNVVRTGFFVALGTAIIVFLVGLSQPSPATPISPDIGSFNIFEHGALFSAAVLWLLGVEMPFTMGDEYGDHKRTAGSMLIWGTLALMTGYLMGIVGILYCLPIDGIDATNGVAQAVQAHYPLLGGCVATAIWIAVISQDVAYLNTYSRLLYVSALEKRLPRILGQLNRKKVPQNALITQAIGATLVIVIFAAQESLVVAFNLYLAALVVLWCLSLYYIFGALLMIGRLPQIAVKNETIWNIPGGRIGRWTVAVWGIIANTIAIYYVFALPWVNKGITVDAWRLWLFATVSGVTLIGIGLWLYSKGARKNLT